LRRSHRIAVLCALAFSALATPSAAAPTANSDSEYQALGRVFPDPLGACGHLGNEPCSPHAQGNLGATSFIQWNEFVEALQYLNSKPEWQRYLEVLPLDGKMGDYAAGEAVNADGKKAFPGNTLSDMGFTPRKAYVSAGVPTTDLGRKRSDLYVLRVTDENVPDAGKKRMTLSLSIHGIERAGLEGGTRAMEDLVTAVTTGKATQPLVPESVKKGAPTFGDVLRNTVVYFTYPNPDGWRRGSISEGGLSFQRYNGNGVDPNRDWPDIGYSFRGYSGASEPETRAFMGFYDDMRTGGVKFDAGDDLHGQPFADALSYTMLPHGRHDLGKDTRLRETAKTIHFASYEALKWSPMVQPNDAPRGGGAPCADDTLGDACARIYGQTWGTVYDTINYTTTGTLGDWFDSSAGLNADGIDNEMSFSHIDKDTRFDPHTEQLHVDGNKALLYAHLADMLAPVTGTFDAPGRMGYVPSPRLKRAERQLQAGAPPGTQPQAPVEGTSDPSGSDGSKYLFQVHRTNEVYNGGMRVDVTTTNVQGLQPGDRTIAMKVQCKGCDEHVRTGPFDDTDWVTVSEDWNQQQLYARAGLTASVNRPDAHKPDGTPVEWRVLTSPQAGRVKVRVEFTSGPATGDGGYVAGRPGDAPPKLHAYDVANTDVFGDLNQFVTDPAERFGAIDPRKVIAGEQSLDGLDTLVLADSLLPGYTGRYAGEGVLGPQTPDFAFESEKPTTPSQGNEGCIRSDASVERRDFTIAPTDGNASMRVEIHWGLDASDYDMWLMRKGSNGEYRDVKGSQQGFPPTTEEHIDIRVPAPGDYRVEIVNCTATAADPWAGTVKFVQLEPVASGDYTTAEKDAWTAKLKAWVQGGGNLVLTDGALRGLGEVTGIPGSAVQETTVYAGQVSFMRDVDANGEADEEDTLADPLARDVDQPGARFNDGMRRQTYEPTPLGFAIQNQTGGDESHARQFDVDIDAFTEAGGRVVATSSDSEARTAAPVLDRVTIGEIPVGQGKVRVAGALLPQPETSYDHPLGLEPYAMTYTGNILLCNLLGAECGVKAVPAGSSGSGAGGSGGDGANGGGNGGAANGAGTGSAPRGGSVAGGSPRAGGGASCRDRFAPASAISRGSLRASRTGLALSGTSRDRGCGARGAGAVRRVYVAVYRSEPGGCRHLRADGRLSARRACNRPILLRAVGAARWRFAKRVRLPRGRYVAWVVGRDAAGNQERGGAAARRASFVLR
jgi:zinc carboxypeptidase